MRKHKVGIIGVIFLQIIALVILSVPEIYATETKETTEKLTCKDLAEKFGFSINKDTAAGKFTLAKGKPSCDDYAENHSKETYKIVKINGAGVKNGGLIGADGKKSIQFEAGWQISGNKHYVTVELENTNPEAKDLEYQFIEVKYSDIVEEKGSSSVKTVVNTRYSENACQTFRDEAGTTSSEKYKFYSGSVPECFKTRVVKVTTAAKVADKIKNTKELWTIYKSGATTPADFETIKNKAKIKNPKTNKNNVIDNPSGQTICLNCNYKFVNTGNKEIVDYKNYYGDTIKSAEYYLNKDYYYSEGKETTDSIDYTYNYAIGDTKVVTYPSCKRKCEEAVQLEYGPPVASKAGLCFEYKVKVTSYVKCSAEFVAPDPSYTTPACTPAPRCESVEGQERNKPQAGPTEEFEACVQKCDGGKYTEKCSISCYKQAYGNTSTKLAINYENIAATRLADATSKYTIKECLEENEDYYGCYERTSSAINWYALDNYKTDGKIDTSKQTVLYNNENSLGRWYLDRAYSEHGSNYDAGGYDISGIKTCTDKTYCGKYVADSNGFYRRNYSGSLCDDICEWQQTCEKDKYLNPGTIVADEERNRAIYEAAKTACVASNSCETHQATFSISINYDKGNNKDETTITRIDFPFTSDADSIGKGKAEDNQPKTMAGLTPGKASGDFDSIILDKDGCYKDKNTTNKYMTEWSFPGTYIHNKTGEISFAEKSGDGWYYDDQKFCMPLDAESVNTKWWEWYKLGNKCYTAAQIEDELKGKTGTSNGYNIVARTRNFGKFKWNFDIKCFYALRNEICNVKENGCCGPNKKENNGVMNYTFRTIDKGNMFPNALEPGVVDPTKREIGFNWTDKAKTSKNPEYEINPTALIEHIQSNSSSLYDSDKESDNLDYRFHLTPEDLASIRKDNKEHSYGKWTNGKINKNPVNGVYVYQSNLFRDTSGTRILSGDSIIKLGELGENNQGSQPRGAE